MSKIMRSMYAEARGEQSAEPLHRYSVDPQDAAGYMNWLNARAAHRGKCIVTLDGEALASCVMADEVEGVVEQVEQPLRVTEDFKLATITRRGLVRMRWGE